MLFILINHFKGEDIMSKKNDKKKKAKKPNLCYGVHIEGTILTQENFNGSQYDLVKEEYTEKPSSPIMFLPKKIDSLIKKIEKLGVQAVNITVSPSRYRIRFIEDKKSTGWADLLNDIYVNNPADYVFFAESDKTIGIPKSYLLVIDIEGPPAQSIDDRWYSFGPLGAVVSVAEELKACSKYVDTVIDAVKHDKKAKFKKLFKEKK